MNIVITNYYSASNRGDAAILEGVIAALDRQIENASFDILTENVKAAELINGVSVHEQRISPQKWKKWIKTGNISKALEGIDKELYERADLIVSTGGHHLTDTYFPAKLGMLLELAYCNRLDAPVALIGQTVGPLNDQPYRMLTRRVLNGVDLITVRDRRSLKVVNELQLTDVKTEFTADAAFAMTDAPISEPPITRHRMEDVPIADSSNQLVTISVREVEEFYDTDTAERYYNSVAELADFFITKKNAEVTFLSTCTGIANYTKDDREVAHEVCSKMESRKASIVQGEYTPHELITICQQADLHVGTRMHSCILASKAGTPFVGIEYQYKVGELLNQFGMSEYGVEIGSMTTSSLLETCEKAFNQRGVLAETMGARTHDLIDRSKENGRLAADLIS